MGFDEVRPTATIDKRTGRIRLEFISWENAVTVAKLEPGVRKNKVRLSAGPQVLDWVSKTPEANDYYIRISGNEAPLVKTEKEFLNTIALKAKKGVIKTQICYSLGTTNAAYIIPVYNNGLLTFANLPGSIFFLADTNRLVGFQVMCAD